MSQTQLTTLTQKISRETEKVETWFRSNDLPLPGFDAASPGDMPHMPEDIATSRKEIIHATEELRKSIRE